MDFRKFITKNRIIDIETCLPYGLAFVTAEGMISWVNEQLIQDMDISKDNIIASHIDIFFPDGYEAVVKSVNSQSSEIICHEASGRNFTIKAKAIDDGYVVDFRPADEYTKKRLSKEEILANVNKNNLIVKLSNDIKSPIQSIIGFSQALIDGLGGEMSEKQEKYTKIIYKNSNDLLYLTEKFIELSKSELGLIEKDYKVLDIANLVLTIVRFNEQLYKDKSLEIKFESDTSVRKAFNADENGIRLAIQNILDTVIRYMDLGSISVVLSVPPTSLLESVSMYNGVLISIICTGFSLTETELNTIFNPYAVTESVSKRFAARSMALTAVKNIIEDMSGQIWVTSEILKNTTFNILIPIKERD